MKTSDFRNLYNSVCKVLVESTKQRPFATKTQSTFTIPPEQTSHGEVTTSKTGAVEQKPKKDIKLSLNQAARKAMAHVNIRDLEGYEDLPPKHAYTKVEPKTSNLPIVKTTLPAQREKIKPDWYKVSDLPGYSYGAIREAGRQMFKHFTNHPIENIDVLSSHTHPEEHLKAVAAHAIKHGVNLKKGTLEMSKFIPGWETHMVHYVTPEHHYLIQKDVTGHYIYRWPNTSKPVDFKTKQIETK